MEGVSEIEPLRDSKSARKYVERVHCHNLTSDLQPGAMQKPSTASCI